MKNYMTVEQLMMCADELTTYADSYGRLAHDNRTKLEAIWNIPAESRTDSDVQKAEMLDEEYGRYTNKQTAFYALAGIIKDLKIEVCLMTEGV